MRIRPRSRCTPIAHFIAGLACCTTCLVAHAQSTPEEAARALLTRQRDAWNRADIDAFMNDYWHNEQLRFAGGDTVRTGWQETIERYRKTYPDPSAMGKLDFDLVEVRELTPAVVYVFGKWKLTRSNDAPDKAPHGLFTLIVEQKGGTWVITRDHTSAAER